MTQRSAPHLPPGDAIITATSDTGGYHLYAASAGGRWAWQPLATLQPAGYDGERWIGQHCLTGDGRFVVAVVAPWSANNTADGLSHGALAYAVDVGSGVVHPLVDHVALSYFNPGCGNAAATVLTRYPDADGHRTEVLLADPDTAQVHSVATIDGHLTSAVASTGTVYAARGGDVVRVTSAGATTEFSVPGQAFRLTANDRNGLDLLAAGANGTAQAWRWDGRTARKAGTGSLQQVKLFAGRGGHNRLVVAAGDRVSGTGAALPLATVPAGFDTQAASLDGTAVLSTTSAGAPARIAAVRSGSTLAATLPSGQVRAYQGLPAQRSAAASGAARTATSSGPRSATAAGASSPACAVPRNDVANQARQPVSAQVEWAANRAGRGTLTGPAGSLLRPANAFNLGLPAYSPSQDFKLSAPFGVQGAHVPREVIDGVFAQESNWAQASWHAVAGLGGNPLVADYYGFEKTGQVDYSAADCGYGLGQLTDMMKMGSGGQPTPLQRKVAADYAENAAATAQVLVDKWVQLTEAGITVDSNNPGSLENWYFVLWAYNSGVNPQASTGNTTGCRPSPTCTDAAGNWGLGWTNNPARPDFDPQRHPFLHDGIAGAAARTPDDARHPQDWPYQEKVFGWMESGQDDFVAGGQKFTGTYDYAQQTGNFLELPGVLQFCRSSNNCDPQLINPLPHGGVCQRADLHCWWHGPATICLTIACTGGTDTVSDTAPEPVAVNPYPPVCTPSASGLPSGAVVVDNQPNGLNVVGCDPGRVGNAGTFSVARCVLCTPDSQGNDVDWHQLSAGYGGHLWFTHTMTASDPHPEWSAEGTWTPNTLGRGRYKVYAFVPNSAATATVTYHVGNGAGSVFSATINQSQYANQWVSLGSYWLGPGARVYLNNVVADAGLSGADVAFDAVAFAPTSTGTLALLGDSYSAGEGAGTYDPDTIVGTDSCHRSPYSWQRLVQSTSVTYRTGGWTQKACSGALIADFYQPNHSWSVEPAQRNSLSANTGLVMLSMSGNDAGFADLIKTCVLQKLLNDCENHYTVDGVDQELQRIAALDKPLLQMLNDIRATSPDAEIHLLTYPRVFITDDTQRRSPCVADGAFSLDDRKWLDKLTTQLDDLIVRQAQRAGVDVIDVRDTFAGHELCTTGTTWMNGILGTSWQQEWVHPLAAGYQAEAALVRSRLQLP